MPRLSRKGKVSVVATSAGRLNETSNVHALQDRRSALNSQSVPTAPFRAGAFNAKSTRLAAA